MSNCLLQFWKSDGFPLKKSGLATLILVGVVTVLVMFIMSVVDVNFFDSFSAGDKENLHWSGVEQTEVDDDGLDVGKNIEAYSCGWFWVWLTKHKLTDILHNVILRNIVHMTKKKCWRL